MTTFQIKILAIATMVLDHVGAFLLPEIFILRVIGRLSFLLFAWLLANGAQHTKDIHTYLKRIFIFGLISQPIFILVHKNQDMAVWDLNIFFTLFLGLVGIIILKRVPNLIARIFLCISLGILAEIFCGGYSYGSYGLVAILIFYAYYDNLKVAAALQALVIFIFYTIPLLLVYGSFFNLIQTSARVAFLQPVALVSLLPLFLYNGKEGPKAKVFFYLFYPLHLGIIYLILVLV
ncbi:MAG: TraX family protein [Microgenomates group bacterium]